MLALAASRALLPGRPGGFRLRLSGALRQLGRRLLNVRWQPRGGESRETGANRLPAKGFARRRRQSFSASRRAGKARIHFPRTDAADAAKAIAAQADSMGVPVVEANHGVKLLGKPTQDIGKA